MRTLFDYYGEEVKESKRLVDNSNLNSNDYYVLEYLKQNGLGKKNKVSGSELQKMFGYDSTVKVRNHIKKLRNDPTVDVIIGSDNGGYYIPTQDEYFESVALMLNKTLSQVETIVKMYPRSAKMVHIVASSTYKKVDKAPLRQTQIKFNGWERDFIKRFADDYLEIEGENEWII